MSRGLGPAFCVAAGLSWACTSGELFVFGEAVPSGATTVLVALEQENLRYLEAMLPGEVTHGLMVPEPLDTSRPALLTRIALSQSLAEIGLETPGAMTPAAEPARNLPSLVPLEVASARLFESGVEAQLTTAELSPWLQQFKIPKLVRCPSLDPEFVVDAGVLVDLVSLGPDAAIGLSDQGLVRLESEGRHRRIPLPAGETGTGIGLSRNGALWVVTTSRAIALDPDTGVISRSVTLPMPGVYRGVFDDEDTGELFLVSTDVDLWRHDQRTANWTLEFTVPRAFIRIPEVAGVPARFVRGRLAGHFFLAMEEVSAVVERSPVEIKLFQGDRTGAGFPVIVRLSDDSVLVSESFGGDLYRYDGTKWSGSMSGPSRLRGAALMEDGRLLFLTVRSVIGVLDLDDPNSCPDVPILNWDNGVALARTGDDFWIGISTNVRTVRGWARLRPTFELH